MFQKATKKRARGRIGLIGPSGSGKTYTGLIIASTLAGDKRVAVIDTEHGSASKYADLFDFDVVEPDDFGPLSYIKAMNAAAQHGYGAILIDSLSHAWMGKGGALELVDAAAARSQSKNSFAAWREVTPQHNALIEAIIASPCHVIATMRAKTEWVLEEDERTHRKTPRKIGMAPVQRDGMEYEFDVTGDLDADNRLIISKTRCPALAGKVIPKPDAAFAQTILDWLSDGVVDTAKDAFVQAAVEKFDAKVERVEPAKKSAGDLIKGTRTPSMLVSLLKGWENAKPVGGNAAFWEKVVPAVMDRYEEAGWGLQSPGGEELHETLESIGKALKWVKEVEATV